MKKIYSIMFAALLATASVLAQDAQPAVNSDVDAVLKEKADTAATKPATESDFTPGFRWSVGGEIVSQYIWRGINSGGLSFQPSVEIGYEGYRAGFTVGAWGNLGGINEADEWTQKYFGFGGKYGATFNPELDVYVGFNVGGFSMTLTHYHYFNQPWYNMGNAPEYEESFDDPNDENKVTAVDINGWPGNQLEVTAQYRVSDEIPLTISWNTILAGTDGYYKKDGKVITSLEDDDALPVSEDAIKEFPSLAEQPYCYRGMVNNLDENGNLMTDAEGNIIRPEVAKLKQAFSTYVEVSYDIYLNDVLTLTPTVGFTPWRSMYTNYERKFAVNNLNVRLQADLEFNHCAMNIFAQPFLNFDDIKNFEYGRNFSWVIGLGIWFGNK